VPIVGIVRIFTFAPQLDWATDLAWGLVTVTMY